LIIQTIVQYYQRCQERFQGERCVRRVSTIAADSREQI
jgi:hypothetical protein